MGKITLPRYLITQLTMPGGRRTSPKPKLVIPVAINQPSSADEFANWEYRFWARDALDSAPDCYITECRACGGMVGDRKEARLYHHKVANCTTLLTDSYKLLLRDKRCVICDQRTSRAKWGVPLCCLGCETAWCSVETQPQALAQALMMVEVNHK